MEVKFSEVLTRSLTREELNTLKKAELVELVCLYQQRASLLTSLMHSAMGLTENLADLLVQVSRRLLVALDLLFSKSLKSHASKKKRKQKPEKKLPLHGKQLPSIRYPYLEVIPQEKREESPPTCACGQQMTETKMREFSEKLEVEPKRFYIKRYEQVIYRCNCCKSGIATAKPEPQIIPGSCYGDSIVQDVVLSKLCDLIPVTRYTDIAARHGVEDIPSNSLYGFFKHLAIYLSPSHRRLRAEIVLSRILCADETRHNMLEGSDRKNWYLWSFNCNLGILYLIRDSRAGAVASDFLSECACEFLVTDAYRGYSTALGVVNKQRSLSAPHTPIQSAYCNAHARNNFCATSIKDTKVARRMVQIYKIIFHHYPSFCSDDSAISAKAKKTLWRGFNLIKKTAESELEGLSKKSALYNALNYVVEYFPNLTLFLDHPSVPMHNQRSEQSLRNPVIGRKIWFGTHSVDAASDIAKIMSLVESCKLLGVNPRKYVADAISRVHAGLSAVSPHEYWKLSNSS